jgi:heat shock protein HslJ
MNVTASLSRCVGPVLAASVLSALVAAALLPPAKAQAEAFPFGRELLLDVAPLRGSKKVPILDIGDGGSADIELWCNAVKAQLIVAGDTITVITGEVSTRVCTPDRARADEDLLAALNEITNWQMEPSALVLTGGSRTLRFRTQTN